MQPFGRPSLEKVLERVRAVDRRAIPDEHDLAGNLAQEHAQETHDGFRIIRVGAHLHEQSPIERDTADRREMIARQLHAQNRRLPPWSPGADCHRQQIKPGFIYPDDGRLILLGFFLMSGQRSFDQCLSASSLR